VVVLVLLIYYFWLALASSLLLELGFYRWYYGPGLVDLATASPASQEARKAALGLAAGPAAAEAAPPLARQLALQRLTLWAMAAAFPFQVLTVPLFLARLRGAVPEQLGLTPSRLGRNLLLGLLGWALLTPLVYGVHQLFLWLFTLWPGGVGEGPALVVLARQPLTATEWGLWLFSVLVWAPAMEEIVFRGLLLRWMAGGRGRAWVGLAGALGLALFRRREALADAWPEPAALAAALLPALCVLALAGVMALVQRLSRSPDGPAIFGSAVLFGFVHADWPSPLALLVLGVGLGLLARRTGSLAGPMLLHALFNAVTPVQLLLVPH
jgi:hypothetical protein